MYLPFRPERPFQQALALNASVRVAGPLVATVASNVAPDGRVRYSFGVSTYLYRVRGMTMGMQSEAFSIGKYLVQGVVVDERGRSGRGCGDSSGKRACLYGQHGAFQRAILEARALCNHGGA